MEQRNLEKALELAAALIRGDRVSASGGNVALYEEYSSNSQVYDALRLILKKFGLELYEYNNALFVSADEDNAGMGDAGFGFTNEELRRALGVRVNKELFLCYLIIYCTMTEFYKTSGSYTYTEFVRHEDVIKAVDSALVLLTLRQGLCLMMLRRTALKRLRCCGMSFLSRRPMTFRDREPPEIPRRAMLNLRLTFLWLRGFSWKIRINIIRQTGSRLWRRIITVSTEAGYTRY